jgi:hypothetical protein
MFSKTFKPFVSRLRYVYVTFTFFILNAVVFEIEMKAMNILTI